MNREIAIRLFIALTDAGYLATLGGGEAKGNPADRREDRGRPAHYSVHVQALHLDHEQIASLLALAEDHLARLVISGNEVRVIG